MNKLAIFTITVFWLWHVFKPMSYGKKDRKSGHNLFSYQIHPGLSKKTRINKNLRTIDFEIWCRCGGHNGTRNVQTTHIIICFLKTFLTNDITLPHLNHEYEVFLLLNILVKFNEQKIFKSGLFQIATIFIRSKLLNEIRRSRKSSRRMKIYDSNYLKGLFYFQKYD